MKTSLRVLCLRLRQCKFVNCISYRLFTVLYFSVRSSRLRALRYGLPILHECQNYLGGGGGLGGSKKNRGTVITSLQPAFRRHDRNFTPFTIHYLRKLLVMKNRPDTFSIDYACLQISPFETVIL